VAPTEEREVIRLDACLEGVAFRLRYPARGNGRIDPVAGGDDDDED
jgi:hypothetical protein